MCGVCNKQAQTTLSSFANMAITKPCASLNMSVTKPSPISQSVRVGSVILEEKNCEKNRVSDFSRHSRFQSKMLKKWLSFFYPRKFGHDPSPYWALDYTRWGFKAQLSELARCIVNPKHSKTLTFCHLCVYNNVQPQLFNCLRRGHSLSGALAKAPWLLKPISKKKKN